MKNLWSSTRAAACAALALVGADSWAASPGDGAALQTRQWAANCAACHGTDGRAAAGASVASLAGTPAATLVEQLKAFKDGKRPATVMHQIAKGLSDAQIQAMADYFAAQPR